METDNAAHIKWNAGLKLHTGCQLWRIARDPPVLRRPGGELRIHKTREVYRRGVGRGIDMLERLDSLFFNLPLLGPGVQAKVHQLILSRLEF